MRSVTFLIVYAVCINLAGCFLMWSDKRRARRLAYRIPEATLFAIALIGGCAGSILGMYLFRHKTKHRRFVIGMPVILVLQIALLLCIRWKWQVYML